MVPARSRHTAVGISASSMSIRIDDGLEMPYENCLRSIRYKGAFSICTLGGSGT